VLAISKNLVMSALHGLTPDTSVLAFKDGKCVKITRTEMSTEVDAGSPGYMLYALLLPGHQYPDMPFEKMPGTAPRPGKDILSVKVLTEQLTEQEVLEEEDSYSASVKKTTSFMAISRPKEEFDSSGLATLPAMGTTNGCQEDAEGYLLSTTQGLVPGGQVHGLVARVEEILASEEDAFLFLGSVRDVEVAYQNSVGEMNTERHKCSWMTLKIASRRHAARLSSLSSSVSRGMYKMPCTNLVCTCTADQFI